MSLMKMKMKSYYSCSIIKFDGVPCSQRGAFVTQISGELQKKDLLIFCLKKVAISDHKIKIKLQKTFKCANNLEYSVSMGDTLCS